MSVMKKPYDTDEHGESLIDLCKLYFDTFGPESAEFQEDADVLKNSIGMPESASMGELHDKCRTCQAMWGSGNATSILLLQCISILARVRRGGNKTAESFFLLWLLHI